MTTAAEYRAIMSADVRATEQDGGGVFSINIYFLGKTLVGQRDEISDTLLGLDAGYEQQFDFPILLRVSQFATLGIRQARAEEYFEIDNPDTTNKTNPRHSLQIKSVKPSQDGVSVVWGVKASN